MGKRIKAAILCIMFVFVLSGCGKKEEIVDLTSLSSTMVYSEVYNMMNNPADYVGKEINAKGEFQSLETGENNDRHYFVVISDATACCAQGLEFYCEDAGYPDQFPQENQPVTVTGIYDSYQEQDNTYYRLVVEQPEHIEK